MTLQLTHPANQTNVNARAVFMVMVVSIVKVDSDPNLRFYLTRFRVDCDDLC